MDESAVTAGEAVHLPEWNLEPFAVFTLDVLHRPSHTSQATSDNTNIAIEPWCHLARVIALNAVARAVFLFEPEYPVGGPPAVSKSQFHGPVLASPDARMYSSAAARIASGPVAP